ncbi:MAG: NAD(P)H-dependent oxidoreductase, partial [Pseudolabrys sp.]
MSTILVLNSSVSGVTSVSRILVKEAVSRLLEAEPGATMVHRDLGAVPIPHLTTTNLAGIRGVPATDVELAARALSDQLIAELRAADTIVIGAPMYNFSIPTGLRAWFDYVLRVGETFSYSEA